MEEARHQVEFAQQQAEAARTQVEEAKRQAIADAQLQVEQAKRAAKEVLATAFFADIDYVRALGADRVIDVQASPFEELLTDVDIVIDTVGGDTLDRSFRVLRRGGVLVSSVATPDAVAAERHGIRAVFFLVDVSSGRLDVRPAIDHWKARGLDFTAMLRPVMTPSPRRRVESQDHGLDRAFHRLCTSLSCRR